MGLMEGADWMWSVCALTTVRVRVHLACVAGNLGEGVHAVGCWYDAGTGRTVWRL